MRYFDNQKYDEAGIVGVKLQKILLFLMIFHLSSFFWGVGLANLVGTICILALLFIGFKGASKRNPKLLRGYCVGSVVYIVGSILIAILGVAFFMFYRPQMDPISEPLLVIPVQANYTSDAPVDSVTPDPSSPQDASVMLDLVPADATNATIDYPPQVDPDVEQSFCWWGIIFMGVILLVGILVFTLHISSIVLASKMSKILIATATQNLAHPRKQSTEPQVVMPAPATVVPIQVQPNNFGYYPMYSVNPGNVQNGQQFFFNPYLQPVQYYPQVNPQGNAQV